ncbi:DUF4214 domain-containing protein [Sulfitobacter sp. M57]|uniref:DUF4214 domain-containing protein n=1 Tax=unclassified Sulfitobacter TaxID=196795 RepID=UPI0023E191B8|nr:MULTISPECIES: DUF4214 domain-containing protein [unclassified Sulfitobacter]MDF3414667.1 DUF4214 domain-containing protein [Sulfitobacter sp. KE5]MDF3422148.1 DUF4214 domain-containing protein [Sulfitobacter sp. KE43]MDF3433213.1 DUF4214 domain-containing protein [Sulfitobacter sp. KE42]MDF3458853.1 DUF4214 domain-containing protein [Sulfitobacter sp. S74]MDF3462752.1 DUF4214 domain-containing protein [Sulfitobacter sp. Ks18]
MIPTNSPLLAGLSPYEQSDVFTTTNVTYSFLGAGVEIDPGNDSGALTTSLDWNAQQRALVQDHFAYISTLVDLTFQQVPAGGTVNIEFIHISQFEDPFVTGVSIPQAPGVSQIVIPTDFIGLDDVTVIHEIGHSIGLSHPFDGPAKLPGVDTDADLGTFSHNTELATRMSYNPGASNLHPGLDITGEPLAFGALDIAALQLLYGANTTTAAGNSVYGIDPALNTIWDTGGQDRIDFSSASDNAVIDLRAATLGLDEGGGGYLSFVGSNGGTVANGGYTIAFGVEIEEARGGSGADVITGNALANMLTGNGGDDVLKGGAGLDTAVYSGSQGFYTLTLGAGGTTIEDRRGNGDGTDTLEEIEALTFGDAAVAPFDLTKFAGTQGLSETQMESVIELYVAYFNRAPDAVGLNFWGTAFANGTTLEQMATLFIDQDETRATYGPDLSNADFVTAVYSNVLGRAGDQAGVDFWLGHLEAGTVGRDQFILGVLQGAKAPIDGGTSEQIAQQGADQQYLSTKTDIGAYYSVTKGMSDTDNASAAMALFDGTQGSVTETQTAIDGYFEAASEADSGMFLMPLVGVVDDPFAVMA